MKDPDHDIGDTIVSCIRHGAAPELGSYQIQHNRDLGLVVVDHQWGEWNQVTPAVAVIDVRRESAVLAAGDDYEPIYEVLEKTAIDVEVRGDTDECPACDGRGYTTEMVDEGRVGEIERMEPCSACNSRGKVSRG